MSSGGEQRGRGWRGCARGMWRSRGAPGASFFLPKRFIAESRASEWEEGLRLAVRPLGGRSLPPTPSFCGERGRE